METRAATIKYQNIKPEDVVMFVCGKERFSRVVKSAVASCVGVRYKNGEFKIYAPYGLNDIFDMIVRPNKATVFTKELYEKKASKWLKMWPKLKVLP